MWRAVVSRRPAVRPTAGNPADFLLADDFGGGPLSADFVEKVAAQPIARSVTIFFSRGLPHLLVDQLA